MQIRKIYILLFLLVTVLYSAIFFALESKSFYNFYKNLDQKYSFIPSLQFIDKGFNEINLPKAMIRRGGVQDINSINLSLSYQDLIAFRDHYYKSINTEGYLLDKGNDWRKAKINFPNNDELRIKVKLHGTSASPIIASKGYINSAIYRIKKSNFGVEEYPKKYIDITKGGYAFKVKLRDDNVYQGISRMNLLAPTDDWTIVGNALNKYMSSLGIITTHGSFYNLFINGSDIGLYLGIENIGKNLLERNFQITNYAILKNVDDWNKGWGLGHISPTMYTSSDMEQSGEPLTQRLALYQLNRLFKAMSEYDYDTIKTIIDIEYFAKVYAGIILTGEVHPIYGDNTKYIYDFSTGVFKVAYRLEGAPTKVSILNSNELKQLKFKYYETHKLFNMLSTQDWFIDATQKYFEKIYRDTDKIVNLINEEKETYKKVSVKSRFPTNHHIYKYYDDLEAVNSNLQIIGEIAKKKYSFNLYQDSHSSKPTLNLKYAKVFFTLIKNLDNQYILKVLNDSLSELTLISVENCSGQKHYFKEKLIIKPSKYSKTSGLIINTEDNNYEIPFMCLQDAHIINNKFKEKIDSKHLYFNYSESFAITNESGVNQLGLGLRKLIDLKNNSVNYLLQKGSYLIKEDLILPKGANLTIEPGAKISLSNGTSIFVRGDLYAKGTKVDPIVIQNLNEQPFGTFAVKGTTLNPSKVIVENFLLEGGSESIIDGTYFSGQFSIHIGDVMINKSVFSNSFSDDGINIKKGNVKITNSTFINNSADQIDLDFVNGYVSNNIFAYSKKNEEVSTDGLDVSGSFLNIMNNKFSNMSDKGLSIGENSKVNIYNNSIKNNNIGIALKDGSRACLKENSFNNNINDISKYIKKNMYSEPVLYIDDQLLNKTNISLDRCNIDNFIKNLKDIST